MVICHTVSQVVGTRRPVVAKWCLRNLAPEPVELHVHGLETLACNVVGYHSECSLRNLPNTKALARPSPTETKHGQIRSKGVLDLPIGT